MIHYNHIEILPKEVCDDYLKEENKILTLLIYVNDLLIICNYVRKIDWIKKQLQKKFDTLDFGQMKYYLHVEFVHLEERIFMIQQSYVTKILIEFGMNGYNMHV
jgi:hypothetical protein